MRGKSWKMWVFYFLLIELCWGESWKILENRICVKIHEVCLVSLTFILENSNQIRAIWFAAHGIKGSIQPKPFGDSVFKIFLLIHSYCFLNAPVTTCQEFADTATQCVCMSRCDLNWCGKESLHLLRLQLSDVDAPQTAFSSWSALLPGQPGAQAVSFFQTSQCAHHCQLRRHQKCEG